jgi:hypothetical protein
MSLVLHWFAACFMTGVGKRVAITTIAFLALGYGTMLGWMACTSVLLSRVANLCGFSV